MQTTNRRSIDTCAPDSKAVRGCGQPDIAAVAVMPTQIGGRGWNVAALETPSG